MKKTTENEQAIPSKVLSLRRKPADSTLPLALKPVKLRNLRDAQKLMSRLIVGFQRGEIAGQDAKTMAFLVSVYVQTAKDTLLEDRLDKIEQHFGVKNE